MDNRAGTANIPESFIGREVDEGEDRAIKGEIIKASKGLEQDVLGEM